MTPLNTASLQFLKINNTQTPKTQKNTAQIQILNEHHISKEIVDVEHYEHGGINFKFSNYQFMRYN